MKHKLLCSTVAASVALSGSLWMAPLCLADEQGVVGTTFQDSSAGTALTYKITGAPQGSQPGTVQIGDGYAPALDQSYSGAVRIPQQVSYNGATYTVTACAAMSFYYSKLSSLTVAKTVTRIGNDAFYNCTGMRSLTFEAGSQLTTIQNRAFQLSDSSGGLRSIALPASLKTLGEYAFAYQCSATSLTFEGDTMTSIGNYAFAGCTALVTAEIPGITAESNGLGALCFNNCTSLKSCTFKGSIASAGFVAGSRTFDNCTALDTVVYRGKKFLPEYHWDGPHKTDPDANFIGFQYSDPQLYLTITYYSSKRDAEAGTSPLGTVCVRSDTPLSSITTSLPKTDASGVVIYEGAVKAPLSGYTGWGYEGSPSLNQAIPDSLYAYPVDASDLQYGSADAAESVLFTGAPLEIEPTVFDASGNLLVRGVDYELSYQRKQASGAWADTTDLASLGEMRVVASGIGAYHGSCASEYSIVNAEFGATFSTEGICYRITKQATVQAPGEVSVGDGIAAAADLGTTGTVQIPQTVSPEGSTLSYTVTSVADYAFGAPLEEKACTQVTSVELPATVARIGNSSFAHCTSLEAFAVPPEVASIGARSFQGCVSLESLKFQGAKLDSLGSYSFEQCSSLKTLVLPAVNQVFDHAFANCVSLSTVEFMGEFGGADFTQFDGCTRLNTVTYHGTVSDAVFSSQPAVYLATGSGASKATYRLVGSGPNYTLSYAACNASGSSAAIPASVKIKGKACKVTKVGANAFKGSSVKTVTVKPTSIASFSKAFTGSKVIKVKVPSAKKAAYKKLLTKKLCGKAVKIS